MFSLIQFMDVTRVYEARPPLWSDRYVWSKEAFLFGLGTAAENTKMEFQTLGVEDDRSLGVSQMPNPK